MSIVLRSQKPHQFDPILPQFWAILRMRVYFDVAFGYFLSQNNSGRRERMQGGVRHASEV